MRDHRTEETSMTTGETPSTTRRQIIRTGVAVGAGAGTAALIASPAAAAPGDAVIIGQDNNAGEAETVLVGGSSANPTLSLTGTSPMLVLAPTPEADIPQELPTGSLAVTPVGDLVIGGKAGTKAYINTSRWANRTLAVPPQRILDTRSIANYSAHIRAGGDGVTSGKLNAGRVIHLTVSNVPPAAAEKATAAYVNITVAGTVSAGFLTAYPSSISRPQTSSLNWWGPNQILSNLVEVQLGSYNGLPLSFAIHVTAAASVIVDVSGLILSDPDRGY
ncbi:hypothetical protein E1193_30725 [Micromonospora sp. KC606]|uniref:hypothetical protein n=1 Tax=Micromonospora sp. KC606 TaxID=2530379 RepID=UPI001047927D|nr:hypothetical protein [Micromonospora sp. KC606]TDC69217.1 hypothetical protein E1193_30725 [Micromonospora sp. KC606]